MPKPTIRRTVHIARITNEYGTRVHVAATRKRAIEWLAGYVREWWQHEMNGDPMPSKIDETAINMYFSSVDGEDYELASKRLTF